MKPKVATKLGKLFDDPRFHGLWCSHEIAAGGGRTRARWSVTFCLDGDCCEIAYRNTVAAAVNEALSVLEDHD